MAALAIGLGPGDEAVVPAYTWVTSANCIEYTGAKAVFADIDLGTYNIDPASLEEAITPRTKAVVVVHLFGLSAPMDRIMAIANKYGLKVIEDAACAVGSTFDGRPVGGIGDIGCFSFHPRKIITTGEGGMLTTNDGKTAEFVASLRNHGTAGGEPGPGAISRPFEMSRVVNLGYNFRLSDIHGAMGLAQLAKLESMLKVRRRIAARYNAALDGLDELAVPFAPDNSEHTYQAYVVRLLKGGKERRDRIMEHLAEKGIWTRPGTQAVHRLEYYQKKYQISSERFPDAVKGEDETITLPCYHQMNEDDFDFVVQSLYTAFYRTK
jgi:dTDP-4-amino-4,6-dideoxygalactose transaminase